MVRNLQVRLPKWLIFLIALGGIGFSVLVGYRLISGRSLGIRSWVDTQIYFLSSYIKVVADQKNVQANNHDQYTNMIFLHHSVGDNIINQGGLRDLLAETGIDLSDQDYIGWGLSGPDGFARGYTLPIPDDNTDPDGLAEIFSQPELPLPLNALSGLMQYEVVMLKSCFPANHVYNDARSDQFKAYYQIVRERITKQPDHFFILLTTPPLNPAETNPQDAGRARELANWLVSDEFLQGYPNLVVYDLYGFLAGDDPSKPDYNMLRADYSIGTDSHPNELANREVALALAEFIQREIVQFRTYERTSE